VNYPLSSGILGRVSEDKFESDEKS
jgi:hypothetical protein